MFWHGFSKRTQERGLIQGLKEARSIPYESQFQFITSHAVPFERADPSAESPPVPRVSKPMCRSPKTLEERTFFSLLWSSKERPARCG